MIPPHDEWAKEAEHTFWWGNWRDPKTQLGYDFLYEDGKKRHEYEKKDNWRSANFPVNYDSDWAQGRMPWEVFLDAYDAWDHERKRIIEVYRRKVETMDYDEAVALFEGKSPLPPVYPAGQNIVLKAAAESDLIPMVESLEELSNDVNGRNVNLWTPLMFAAKDGSLECVEYLVDFGADVSLKNKDQDTAVDIAIHAHGQHQPDHPVILYFKAIEAPRGTGWKSTLAYPQLRPPITLREATSLEPVVRVSQPHALIFPGTGSQYVKMLAGPELAILPAVRDLCSRAEDVLGYDLLKICREGPESKLAQTRYSQPALYVADLCAVELLRKHAPGKVECCQAVAGMDVGEYAALAVAGVLDFETGLALVKLRAESIYEAAQTKAQAMLSVAGLDQQVLERLCEESAREDSSDVCQVSSILFPSGYAVSGTQAAIDRLFKRVQDDTACMQAKVQAPVGFHSPLMQPAKEKLLEALKVAHKKMKPPRCDIYMNAVGKRVPAGTRPKDVADLLAAQMTNCVQWESSVKAMIRDGNKEFFECGPMKQLKAIMKRIDQDAWTATTNIHV